MSKRATKPDVRIGDVWKEADPRCDASPFAVLAVFSATVSIKREGRSARVVKLSRFNGSTSGYRLVSRRVES